MQKPKLELRRSATEWRRIVDRWQRSGQSAEVFAKKHRLSKKSLTWWRWRLRTGASSSTESSAAELAFVPLVASPEASIPASAEARWVLETAAGLRVEMSGATALVVDGLSIALERVRVRGKA
jgi:transposase